jgi:6-phosphogluconolactonase (cycloisomerase 2 family)
MAAAATSFAQAPHNQAGLAHHTILAYVGSYSLPQGPDGSVGRGQGIYLFEMNPTTGGLIAREVFRRDTNPSFMAIDSWRKHLYSVNWISNYQGASSGSVSAYTIDRASGHLTLLNTVSSEGANPTHLSIHPSGKFVLVANYFGGTVAVLPVRANGELGSATDVVHDQGIVGREHAASAPAGSFAISGHDNPHAHMIQSDPAGRFIFAADLGLDRIFIWKFDAERGRLIPNDPASVELPSGDGPRHFAFHPNGHWFYSLQEEGSTLVAYDYDSSKGRLTTKQTVCSLPQGFAGSNFPAEVMISSDGRFLYASNRLHDSIAWFSISATGTLAFGGEEWTRGDHPRAFNFDPTGNFLFCCNQFADAITTFRIDRKTGALTFTGQYTPVGSPASIIFLV